MAVSGFISFCGLYQSCFLRMVYTGFISFVWSSAPSPSPLPHPTHSHPDPYLQPHTTARCTFSKKPCILSISNQRTPFLSPRKCSLQRIYLYIYILCQKFVTNQILSCQIYTGRLRVHGRGAVQAFHRLRGLHYVVFRSQYHGLTLRTLTLTLILTL